MIPGLLAAAGGDAVTATFLQFGVLGAFALVSLGFYLSVYKRETARADRAEQRLEELHRDMRDKVIPVLTDATRTLADVTSTLRDRR